MLPNKLEQNSQTKVRSHEFNPQIVVDSLTVYSKINFTEKKSSNNETAFFTRKTEYESWAMVTHAFDPSIQEAQLQHLQFSFSH